MNTTKTRQVDTFGNVSYAIAVDGRQIGTVQKTCSGYQAEPVNGAWYVPTSSIKAAVQILVSRVA